MGDMGVTSMRSMAYVVFECAGQGAISANHSRARLLIIAGLALAPVIAALFAVGAHQGGGRHTNWDRAAVLVFIAHMVLVGLGINPWRNRFGKRI